MRLILTSLIAGSLAMTAGAVAGADPPPTLRLTLKDHRFEPDTLRAPAGQKFRLEVVNADAAGDEFESASLKVEREIAPHGKLILQLGPLAPGVYPFVGDLHAETAKGQLIAAPDR